MNDNQDKFLTTSLIIGFSIVALIYFYEDYASLLGMEPTAKTEEPVTIEDPIEPVEAPIAKTYIVQENETIYDIADKHNTTVEELIDLNPNKIQRFNSKTDGLWDYSIIVGDELKLE